MTVYFYLDSSHTEDPSKDENGYIKTDDAYVRENEYQPVYIMKWAMLTPLGKIPEKAKLEDKDAVIARIHEAAKYVPLERLYLSPQCGFASCEIGNKLTEEEQWAKLALVKEIAELVWSH